MSSANGHLYSLRKEIGVPHHVKAQFTSNVCGDNVSHFLKEPLEQDTFELRVVFVRYVASII